MEQPTELDLEIMIADLKEQLLYSPDDTISDEIIKEIKYRENQLKQITIKNFTI